MQELIEHFIDKLIPDIPGDQITIFIAKGH